MMIIKEVNELIKDCYAQKVVKWKDKYPTLSRVMHEASLDKMNHVTRFHDEIVKLIAHAAEIKGAQNLYKGA